MHENFIIHRASQTRAPNLSPNKHSKTSGEEQQPRPLKFRPIVTRVTQKNNKTTNARHMYNGRNPKVLDSGFARNRSVFIESNFTLMVAPPCSPKYPAISVGDSSACRRASLSLSLSFSVPMQPGIPWPPRIYAPGHS